MDKEVARAATQFMARVQLTGAEVPAFNAVMEALVKIIQKEEEVANGPE